MESFAKFAESNVQGVGPKSEAPRIDVSVSSMFGPIDIDVCSYARAVVVFVVFRVPSSVACPCKLALQKT